MFDGSYLRRQLACGISLLTGIIMVPFTIWNFLTDQILLAGLSGGVAVLLLLVSIMITYVGRIPRMLVLLGAGAASVTVVVATIEVGYAGMLWCYPLPLLLFSLLSTRDAIWIGAPTVLALITIAILTFSELLALRAVATISLTWGISGVFAINIERQHRQLSDLALQDPLTGLGNRRAFFSDLARALASKQRNDTPATLIIFDVDHFKSLNDRHGHQYGDTVLEQLANRVQGALRGEDRLYRTGGEEFAILLPETGIDGALQVAKRVKDVVRTSAEEEPVTVSQGVAELRKCDALETWVKFADEAMYQAKHAGRDCIRSANTPVASAEQVNFSEPCELKSEGAC